MPRNTVPIDHVRWRRRQRRVAVLYILSKNKSLDGLKCFTSQIKLFQSCSYVFSLIQFFQKWDACITQYWQQPVQLINIT